MSRPLRIEFPDALYHVTARGDRREAIFEFVAEGIKAGSPWSKLKGQVYLGDEHFVKRMQSGLQSGKQDDVQIPGAQRRPPAASLAEIERHAENRNAAIVKAYATGAYSFQQIADHFGIHFTTVGRIVRGNG
jgi:hypothetical protein